MRILSATIIFDRDRSASLAAADGGRGFKAALSPLQFYLAHEIAFSKRRALVAENVVSRGRMEKEVRQRERH
jgi:hypothetical protein